MKMYGIMKPDGELFRVSYFAGNSEDSSDNTVSFMLEKDADILWLVPDRETAENVLAQSTAWYNADYADPEWFDSGAVGHKFMRQCKVVEVVLTYELM